MNAVFMEKFNNRLNMIRLTAKPVVENEAAWQQHGTPDLVIDMMLDMYYENNEFKNNERILILFNVEFINRIYIKYKDELIFGNLYFVADSKEKYDVIKKQFPTVHVVLCDEHEVEKLVEKIGEFEVKKFDVVFSNPPYNDNLDLKILKYLFNISKSIIFVHPSTFLIDSRNVEQLYKELKSSNFLQKATLFWANSLFNIKLFCPCVISVWDTTKLTKYVEITDKAYKNWFYNGKVKIYSCETTNMNLHGSMIKNILPLRNKLNSFINDENTLFYKRNLFSKLTNFNVVFPRIRGGSDILKKDGDNSCEHFFSFFGYQNEDYKQNSQFSFRENTPDNEKLIWSFNSEIERNNFISYCKSKVSRFFLSLIKKNGNLHRGELKGIPWLDFTQEWNDAKLCKEFGISEELWNYIDNFIPNYYDDYKSGFEKEEK